MSRLAAGNARLGGTDRSEGAFVVDDQHYDVIVIGTGAGGGTLAYKLAGT